MRNKIFLTIGFWAYLIFCKDLGLAETMPTPVEAQEVPVVEDVFDKIINEIKDPFLSQLPKKAEPVPSQPLPLKQVPIIIKPVQKVAPPPPLPVVDVVITAPKIVVSGLVWGREIKDQQAIVEDSIVGVGGSIKGAKVVSISRSGLKVLYQGKYFTYNVKE